MHEIRATLPPEQVAAATRLARQAGIDRVSVADVYVHGPDQSAPKRAYNLVRMRNLAQAAA